MARPESGQSWLPEADHARSLVTAHYLPLTVYRLTAEMAGSDLAEELDWPAG
jgi:hypothetical protein